MAEALQAPTWHAQWVLPVTPEGEQQLGFTVPDGIEFDSGLKAYFRNFSFEAGEVVGTNMVETQLSEFEECNEVDFEDYPAGTIVSDQFDGVTISAVSDNPNGVDAAILFDSAMPTGGDDDLMTPGYGFLNFIAFNNILIIAENVDDFATEADGIPDGLVDDPDDEGWGGTLTFEFEDDVFLGIIGLLDLDHNEDSFIRFYDSTGDLIIGLPLLPFGDNGLLPLPLYFDEHPFRVMEIEFGGSGAVTDFGFCFVEDGHGHPGPNN